MCAATAPMHYIGHTSVGTTTAASVSSSRSISTASARVLSGEGNGPLDALMHAIGAPVRIQHYEERALTQGADARAIAIAEMAGADVAGSAFGVGIDANLVTASIRAVISGVNRAYAAPCGGARRLLRCGIERRGAA